MSVQTELVAAQAKIEELNGQLARLQEKTKADAESTMQGWLQTQADLDEANANLETANAALTEANERIAKLEAEAKSADARALEIAASQGIPEAEVEVNSGGTAPQTKEEIVAAFNAMKPGAARSEFYQKNRSVLR